MTTFCFVLDCGEWSDNLATTWIVELVSSLVQRGRVVLLRWAKHHDASLCGPRELDDTKITDRSFDVILTIQSQFSQPAMWLGQTYPHDVLTHLMGAITRESESRARVGAFPAEV